jgi:O-methyltransferase
MDNAVIARLAADNEDMSDIDRLVNIYWGLSQALVFGVPGDIAEVGCNKGLTSVFLQMVNEAYGDHRELHVYDSFQGLPPPGPRDAYLREGDCLCSAEDLKATFARWRVRPPVVHSGWFTDTLPSGLPDAICFAYLDSDFYDSIKTSLEHVWPRLSPNGLILVDDYADKDKNPSAWDGLPGVRAAVDEYFACRQERPFVLFGSGDLAMAGVRKAAGPGGTR